MSGKYNGYSNRETWLVKLWGFLDIFEGQKVDAEMLEDSFYEFYGESLQTTGLLADLFDGAINAIDWEELATMHNEDEEWFVD